MVFFFSESKFPFITEILKVRSVNPLVNAGAIASVIMVKAKNREERWRFVLDKMYNFAEKCFKQMGKRSQSEYATAWSKRSVAIHLYNFQRL